MEENLFKQITSSNTCLHLINAPDVFKTDILRVLKDDLEKEGKTVYMEDSIVFMENVCESIKYNSYQSFIDEIHKIEEICFLLLLRKHIYPKL